jgi:uncharacterized protein YdcH (DUF465 family)
MSNIVVHKNVVTQFALMNDFADLPSGKICLLYGDKRVFSLSLLLASQALIKSKSLAVVDGCNRFNVHTISHFARQRRINPEVLLKRIYISRGFTSYQMEAAVNDRLVPFLERIGSNTALIFGLLDTFYDEQVPFREAKGMLQRIVIQLDKMRRQGISILLASTEWNVQPSERNQLFDSLKQVADTVYKLAVTAPEYVQQVTADKNRKQKLEFNDEIKLLVEKERSNEYGKNASNVYENNRR